MTLPYSAFPDPIEPPGSEPDAAPLAFVGFSQEWLKYILGTLANLLDKGMWKANDADADLAVKRANNLLDIFAGADTMSLNTWYSGSGVPGDIGIVGDFYLETTTGDVWKKLSTGWAQELNIDSRFNDPATFTGAPGTDATVAMVGSGTPTDPYHLTFTIPRGDPGTPADTSAFLVKAPTGGQNYITATNANGIVINQTGDYGSAIQVNASGYSAALDVTPAGGGYGIDIHSTTGHSKALNVNGAGFDADGRLVLNNAGTPSGELAGYEGYVWFREGANGTEPVFVHVTPLGFPSVQPLQGPDGSPGSPGTNGTNGATWYSGSGLPGSIGVAGDFYLNVDTSDVYKKVLTGWSFLLNIKGQTGATGAAGTNGTSIIPVITLPASGESITFEMLINSTGSFLPVVLPAGYQIQVIGGRGVWGSTYLPGPSDTDYITTYDGTQVVGTGTAPIPSSPYALTTPYGRVALQHYATDGTTETHYRDATVLYTTVANEVIEFIQNNDISARPVGYGQVIATIQITNPVPVITNFTYTGSTGPATAQVGDTITINMNSNDNPSNGFAFNGSWKADKLLTISNLVVTGFVPYGGITYCWWYDPVPVAADCYGSSIIAPGRTVQGFGGHSQASWSMSFKIEAFS